MANRLSQWARERRRGDRTRGAPTSVAGFLFTIGLCATPGLATAAGSSADVPRAPDGHADLSGNWTNKALTVLTRDKKLNKLVLSEAEAQAYLAGHPRVKGVAADAVPTDPSVGAPPAGAVGGGYNRFWMDWGTSLGLVKGAYRSSWIIDPADGQLPLTEAGKARSREAAITSDREDPTGPEDLAPNDRCLLGSRGSGGPGMLNNNYNSNYQIVQTRTHVVFFIEMGGDARAIPLFPDKAKATAAHGPAALAPWRGDSVGWWEGDTLVVETINVNPQQGRFGPIFLSPKGVVIERFTRVSRAQILHEFSVDDPVYYTRPWRAELTFNTLSGQVYEYACHEGNYAMAGVLGGTRRAEAEAAAKAKESPAP